ncbi:hypothetical protein PybrP1_007766 [[Pythium] brassicae (nom. inval.)]|nr:hypothetical protein PybrP1_007766 [[Pythium] brassicae (nom. inval.)]
MLVASGSNSDSGACGETRGVGVVVLSVRVDHAISAVYDAMTQEEVAGSAGENPHEPQDPAALKRARRTEIEKKSRQRRQSLLRRMRDDVHRLECVYADLQARKAASSAAPNALLAHPMRRGSASTSATALKQMHARLTATAHALTDARTHMQRLLQEHALFREVVNALGAAQDAAPDGVPASRSFAAGFRLLSPAECFALIRASHDAICRFDRSADFESTGASFMGWTDRRRFDAETSALHYGFAKSYPHESAEALLLKTWDMFRDETKLARLSFDASVKMKFDVLQTIGSDVYIIRRDHQHKGLPYTFLTVHILFRLASAEGFTLCFRSIPAPEIQQALEPHEVWFDVFHWTHFNHIRDENGNAIGCEVVTGGSIEDPSMLAARHWLLELIISVLRWENSCVSPLFIKL